MTPEDIDDICRIERETFLDDAWPRSVFEEDIGDNSSFWPVVRNSSGRVLAYANMRIFSDRAYMTNLAVEKTMRRLGLGSLLMQHMIERAENENCVAISLDVRASNDSAQKLYRQFGFRELYRTKNYYQNPLEDSVVMFCDLGERNSSG